jgi:hypothetical protein
MRLSLQGRGWQIFLLLFKFFFFAAVTVYEVQIVGRGWWVPPRADVGREVGGRKGGREKAEVVGH